MLTFDTKLDKILFVRRSGGMADAQASGACSRKAVWVRSRHLLHWKNSSGKREEFFFARINLVTFNFICVSQEWRNGRRAGFRCL